MRLSRLSNRQLLRLLKNGEVRFAKPARGSLLRNGLTKEEKQQNIRYLKEKQKSAIAVKALLKRVFGASEFKTLTKNAINIPFPYLRDHVLPFYNGESYYIKEINEAIKWCQWYIDMFEDDLKNFQ